MYARCILLLAAGALLFGSCGGPKSTKPATLTVAAASNLTGVFDRIGSAFQKQTGVTVVLSYGSTAQLTRQIANGAPFDLFASADTHHVDQLVEMGKLRADSRVVYARGELVLWVPGRTTVEIRSLHDLTRPEVRYVAIAQPALAPYGKAAEQALRASGIWDALQSKLVYASDIRMARQFAATGNADAAFTAYSLVLSDPEHVVKVDPKLYTPIDQAMGIVTASVQTGLARRFSEFLLGPEGRAILETSGYLANPRRSN